MNFSSLFGILFGMTVFGMALSHTSDDLLMFFDPHGLLIVVGGTAAAASICFPIGKVLTLMKVFVLRVLGHRKPDYQAVIQEILDLNKKAGLGLPALKDAVPRIRNDFLKEAVELVASGILSENELRTTLEQRVKTTEARLMHEANMFRTIGRFPPAFGLLATTLGMIALLRKIGQPDSQKLIGPAMSIGLIGTLYGISLANLVFIPIAENLTERTIEEITLRKMIVEGAVMLRTQVNPLTMREGLNSFLAPGERVKRKQANQAA